LELQCRQEHPAQQSAQRHRQQERQLEQVLPRVQRARQGRRAQAQGLLQAQA
jgi:hypothetical protein